MTCIVGFVDKTRVYMGGDSAGVSGYNITPRKDQKVFKNGAFVFGFTSSFRMGQILQYVFKPPPLEEGDIMQYMVGSFIPAIRGEFKNEGFALINQNRETGGQFLVGVQSRLFRIDSDFQVGESLQPFEAIGAGNEYALGALHSLQSKKMKPKDRLTKALEAAACFSGAVIPPFNFVS